MLITTVAQAVNARVLAAPLVPNPDPKPPPGLENAGNNIISYFKYGGIIAGVVGFMICGIMMAIGRRNRSQLATDGATGIPWVIGGLIMVVSSSAIVAGLLA